MDNTISPAFNLMGELLKIFIRPFSELNWPGTSYSILSVYIFFGLAAFGIFVLKVMFGSFADGLGVSPGAFASNRGRALRNKIDKNKKEKNKKTKKNS